VRGGAIVIFTPEELAEMLAVADGGVKTAICIGAFAGIRQAEILRLKWEDFNWAEEVIDLGEDQTKTASRRLVPILPALAAWLADCKKTRGPVLPFKSEKTLGSAYKAVVGKVNEARPEGQRNFEWKRNGLRHSYASYRMTEVQDAAKVALEMGNSPQKIFNHYRKVVTKSQAIAWFGIMPSAPENVLRIGTAA
ncbi:MAG: tyrosine-type recombinase/integrase, partial [Verrucomicrobiota bacterium]